MSSDDLVDTRGGVLVPDLAGGTLHLAALTVARDVLGRIRVRKVGSRVGRSARVVRSAVVNYNHIIIIIYNNAAAIQVFVVIVHVVV